MAVINCNVMNLKQILRDNIAKRRGKLGITQAAPAELPHLSPEAMTRIEKGVTAPKLARLESIARNPQWGVPDSLRPYREEKFSRSELVSDALVGFSEEGQDALVNLVLESARLLQDRKGKP